MSKLLHLIILLLFCTTARSQHYFRGTSLSEALVTLDKSSRHYDISFVYDELEDFTVSKTIKRGRSLPDAVREVCGFYPVRVTVKGRDILVECIQKERKKLKGKLIGPDHQPVAYANIVLSEDSSLQTGGVSNEAGDFVIPCGAERVNVRISCVGFKTIERTLKVGNVGTISMEIENNLLDNVTINGRMHVIRSTTDRLQYLVSRDPFACGLSVTELLSRVPMVDTADGHITILGKGPARYMLNGRMTEPDDAAWQQKLWTLRAEDIERIEVIVVPSGRYLTEDGGGLINIVTRRDHVLGWRGDIGGQLSRSNEWSDRLNASVNYASKHLDWAADFSANRTKKTESTQLNYSEALNINTSDEPAFSGGPAFSDIFSEYYSSSTTDESMKASTSFRYIPHSKIELGGMFSYKESELHNNTRDLTTQLVPANKNSASNSVEANASSQPLHPAHTLSFTAYSDWHPDDKGNLVSLTFNYYRKNENASSLVESYIDGNYSQNKNLNDNAYHIRSVKLDGKLPTKWATMDMGISYSFINNYTDISNYWWELISPYLTRGASSYFPILYEHHNYEEKALAYYASLQKKLTKGLTAYASLRYERSWVRRRAEGEEADGNNIMQGNNSSFHHYLPTLHLNYQLNHNRQLACSWGISIHRPFFHELSPTIIYRNMEASVSGNPAIQLGTTRNFTLSYNDNRGLYIMAYHQHQNNQAVTMMTPVYKYLNHPLLKQYKTMPVDGNTSDKTGILINYRKPLAEWLNLTTECEGYYYSIFDDNKNIYFKLNSGMWSFIDRKNTWIYIEPLNGWAARFSMAADVFLNRSHTLMLNGRYSHKLADYDGIDRYDAYAYSEFSLHYMSQNNRLKLALSISDPFNQHVTSITRNYGGYQTEKFRINHHSRAVSLTATYALGGSKVRRIIHDMKNTESERAEK